MASKAQNVKSALSQPRTRLVFFGGFALVVVVMLVAWMVFVRKSSQAENDLASAVSSPPPLQATSGRPQEATPEYDKLLARDNAKSAEEALQSGGSAIPTPRTGVTKDQVEIGPRPIAGNPTAVPPPETGAYSQQHSDQERQAYEQAVQQRMQAISQQMEKLQGYWSTQPHSSVRLAPESPRQQSAAAVQGAGSVAAASPPIGAPKAAPDIRMGDVKYATLDIGVNTDDPDAPNMVMATIREPGRFNGARLIGQLEAGDQYSKTVGFHFTRLSVVGESKERSIDAWAINPDTARPALASDVNNHYLSRGASIFIGSFLEGYSEGLLRGGQNQSVISNGTTVTVQTDAYTNKQLMQIGAGNVGKKMADVFGQGANRPITIRVDAGADMGVWFVQESSPGAANIVPSLLDTTSQK